MFKAQNKRPTAISLDGCEDIEIIDNTFVGDMNLIEAKNSKRVRAEGNSNYPTRGVVEHPVKSEVKPTKKSWYEKPLGMIGIGVLVTVISAGIVTALGWNAG